MEYLPLTNPQKWLMNEMQKFERPGWVTIEFMVMTKVPMDEKAMKESILYLVNKYESLRVKIISKEGQWVQEIYPLSEADPFAAYDLSQQDQQSQKEALKEICIQERNALLPGRGDLIRLLFFKFSENEGRIWFCMHHVISDLVTVFIVSREFLAIYNSIIKNNVLKWHTVKDYRKWLYIVEGYCRDVLLPTELDYWLSLPWEKTRLIPTDYPDRFYNDDIVIDAIHNKRLVGTYRTANYWIDQEETSKLFSRCGAEFENILIAVFSLAVANCKKLDWLDIHVMNSGRSILSPEYEVNVNRVVGYISLVRAILLKMPAGDNLYLNIQDLIGQIKSIPNAGLGFNLIYPHIKDDALQTAFLNLRKEPILFNYLGRVDLNYGNEQCEMVEEDIGQDLYTAEIRDTLLESVIGIKKNQLFFTINYTEAYFKASTIQEIIHSMVSILREFTVGQVIEKVA